MSKALVPHVNAVLLAMTLSKFERERMDAVDRKLLAEMAVLHRETGERITDMKLTYLGRDEDMAPYWVRRQEEIDAMGCDLPKDHCPALVAEHLQMDAEHAMIEAAEEFFPCVTLNSILCSSGGLAKLETYKDLLIKLVVNAPGYTPPELPQAVA